MIGYSTVGTNDLAAASAFYDQVFAEAGVKRLLDFGPVGLYWGKSLEQPTFGVMRPFDGEPATVGNGSMVAFALRDSALVDAMYAKAMALGGKDEGPPGLRDGNFYAAYFRDLDGNKLVAYSIVPA